MIFLIFMAIRADALYWRLIQYIDNYQIYILYVSWYLYFMITHFPPLQRTKVFSKKEFD